MRLYIHPGLTKTGSTAIQKYLHENAIALKNIGLYYQEVIDEKHNVPGLFRSSGNGYGLYLELVKNSLNDEKKLNVVSQYISRWIDEAVSQGCEDVVISSEVLCLLNQSDLELILKVCCELGIELRFIYFIRNPYDWLFSSWLQGIKRSGVAQWISDILKENVDLTLLAVSFPQKLRRLMRPEHYKEYRYEDVQGNLIDTFLNSLDISSATLENLPKSQESTVNRSLSGYEFAISYYANKASGGNQKLSELLSSLITDDNANRSKFFFVDKYSIDKVNEWCQSHSPCMQDAYKESLSQMAREATFVSENDFANTLSVDQQYVLRSIEIIAGFYRNILGEARELAFHKCKYYSNSEYTRMVPRDFNVFLYMILNEDVLFSNVDPYRHYYEYGQRDNRVYKS